MGKINWRDMDPKLWTKIKFIQALVDSGQDSNDISKEKLEESIYGWGEEIASNAIEVYVHNLRRKLGSDRIRTVRGVGYRVAES